MDHRLTESAVIATGIAYLVGVSLAMSTMPYDIWGIFVAIPPMIVVTVWGVRRLFRGDLDPLVLPLLVGFAAKVTGALARYWIAFDAYEGATDAQRYHDYAAGMAGSVWSGELNIGSVLPGATGTQFVERFTSFVYTLIGSSKLTGFVIFGWLAYWGAVMFVKAACIAVPGLAQRRYAWLCMLAPSVVYWPSSIGKEALMMCFLGIGTYGLARLITRRGFLMPMMWTIVGIGTAALIRPHIAGVWMLGVFPALLTAFGRSLSGANRGRRGQDAFVLIIVIGVAAVALVIVGQFALRYLQPRADDSTTVSQGITAILEETTRRSGQGGSNFEPIIISGPQDWPQAVLRTLTRPLPQEARGLFQLISAAEMAALIGLCLVSWRRLIALPKSFLTIPYVAFAMTALFAAGLAYSSFANLGILTRQKSLVFPLMLLIPCLPPLGSRADDVDEPVDDREFAGTGDLASFHAAS
jgi:hypothetical protein